ncbi:MAG: T9SS type A sorting domain-containing protein [Aureispira sp.]
MNALTTLLIVGLISCLGTSTSLAQNVTIPDSTFKAYLIGNVFINTNGDTAIQVSEATAYGGTINCFNQNITDLTGIEAFVNLTSLSCRSNQLTSLDVRQNTSLTTLYCSSNQLNNLDLSQNVNLTTVWCYSNQLSSLNLPPSASLTNLICYSNQLSSLDVSQNRGLTFLDGGSNQLASLDVSQNTNLTALRCGSNQLSSLDISQNTSLTALYCNSNPLGSLELRQNTNLTVLDCNSNQLNSLNVKNGNNSNFTLFNARNNLSLTCIEVDDSTYSATNWTQVDVVANFSTNCSMFNNIQTINKAINLSAYPNPTTASITLDFGKCYQEVTIQIYNVIGELVMNQSLENSSSSRLELRGVAGMYFLTIQTEEGRKTFQVIKE